MKGAERKRDFKKRKVVRLIGAASIVGKADDAVGDAGFAADKKQKLASTTGVCRHLLSAKGCHRGDQCRFSHAV